MRVTVKSFESEEKKQDRCPYCVGDDDFHPMKVLSNGRSICEKCGHIVFPDDGAFRCPCLRCIEINFSPRIRRITNRELAQSC
jgi:ribosomal protein L37AE/L43A